MDVPTGFQNCGLEKAECGSVVGASQCMQPPLEPVLSARVAALGDGGELVANYIKTLDLHPPFRQTHLFNRKVQKASSPLTL